MSITSTQPFQETRPYVPGPLTARYQTLVDAPGLDWLAGHRKIRLLGAGGQGVVFLCQRQGSNGFSLPVAVKIFAPDHYRDAEDYARDMSRVAQVAAAVALVQHDNVVDVHDFVAQDSIRVMGMEWVDGYDLGSLLTRHMLEQARQKVSRERWDYLNDVIVTTGPAQPRLKPGIAIQVLRGCLAGLAALHRRGVVHGDLKPSNVMLKRTGNVKIVDIGSAIDLRSPAGRRFWSPAYAAPEVLSGEENTPRSDLASLGYVVVEMLAGRAPFAGMESYGELLEAKQRLEQRLPELLPKEVSCNELLLHLCQRLIATDPARRFAGAEAADLERKGAAAFHRQLVKMDLASEYENDIRVWIEQLG
jgi:serine/threonine protein kinase